MTLSAKHRQMLEDVTADCQTRLPEAKAYLEGRGFTGHAAKRARLGVFSDNWPQYAQMAGRLLIPYLTPAGVVTFKARCMTDHNCKEVGCIKYLAETGVRPRLFNAPALSKAHERITVCEGELDALTLDLLCDIPAVGVPGANSWQPHWRRSFDRLQVTFLADGDQPGRECARTFSTRLGGDVRVIELADGMDVNRLFVAEGPDVLRTLCG